MHFTDGDVVNVAVFLMYGVAVIVKDGVAVPARRRRVLLKVAVRVRGFGMDSVSVLVVDGVVVSLVEGVSVTVVVGVAV